MWLRVAPDGAVTLEDAENFRAFKLVIEGGADNLPLARDALKSFADMPSAEMAWIFEAAVRKFGTTAAWQNSLSAMIEKARPHGWIDPETGAIRAHVEFS